MIATKPEHSLISIFQKYSSHIKLLKIIAICYRWNFISKKNNNIRSSSFITAKEWKAARTALYRVIQAHHYKEEIYKLKKGIPLPKRSPLYRLLPIIDEDSPLRIGGRLQNLLLTSARNIQLFCQDLAYW